MNILNVLKQKWEDRNYPFFIKNDISLYFKDFLNSDYPDLSEIRKGSIVILVGDFNPLAIMTFFKLIELGAIIAPIVDRTTSGIDTKSKIINADFIIVDKEVKKTNSSKNSHDLILSLKKKDNPGIIFFSTGTTGEPKAILHDITLLFERFNTPRQAYRTINFLMFDHMGGINTMLHALYNCGTVISPDNRNVQHILDLCEKYEVELLPATPTFLRMLLMSGSIPNKIPKSLKIISYGTELMDYTTLSQITDLLPEVEFKQTYGLSEFCVLRVKNRDRKDLFIQISGEGVETKIENKMLYIRSTKRMLGYLNAQQPFDDNDWYNTKDIVEEDGNFIKIVGRETDVVNVGGLKFMKSEVEEVFLNHEDVSNVKIFAKKNSITGQHIEATIQPNKGKNIEISEIKKYLKSCLPSHMQPLKIKIGNVEISHRLKKK
ncbi:AMP-binding protein [Pelagibacteraceae bacterium]|jgi:acyl-coenzyme A synthetase/AMP-(fatty) acid ligase|nr:AMP-binding protein [Pelagibacteraceae bacterium]